MVKTKSNEHIPSGEAKVLFRKSTRITTSYSSYTSNLSSIPSFNNSRNGALQANTSRTTKYSNKRRKLTRDISIETEICKVRTYIKNKKTKCIGKRSTSATSKYSTHCSASGPRKRKRPDSIKHNCLNRNYLIKENLKQLLLEWIQTHEVCKEYDKHDAEKVVNLIIHNLNEHGSNTSSKNSSRDTTIKLKKFLKFLSSDSLVSKDMSSVNEQKGNEIHTNIPHSRCTVPNCMKQNSNQYQMISTLSVPKHIAIERFCEPNQTPQQLYSIWISRQASKFYTDSSSLNYSIFSSESMSINQLQGCNKKFGTRYILSKAQIGEKSLPILPEDRLHSYESMPFINRDCVVFLENTTNVGQRVIAKPKIQANKDPNKTVFILDQSNVNEEDLDVRTKKQLKISNSKLKEKSTNLSIRNQLMYEATMIYQVNDPALHNESESKKQMKKDLSKTSEVINLQPKSSKVDTSDYICNTCVGHKTNVCERATSDKELSLNVSRDKNPNKTDKSKHKEHKNMKSKEKREKEHKPNRGTSHKSNRYSDDKLYRHSKFLTSFSKLRHKHNIHKLLKKSYSKRHKKADPDDLVDPVKKLIKDVQSLFRAVSNKDENLKIDIKINVLKKPETNKRNTATSHQQQKPKKLSVPDETEYPNKQHVDDLKREISTKQLILYESVVGSSGVLMEKTTSSSETTTIENLTATIDSSLNIEFSKSSASGNEPQRDCNLPKKMSSNDANSKLVIKAQRVPKIVPLLDSNAVSKTAYLFKHSLPNVEFFEHKNNNALYQVVNNMSKRPSVQEISEELKELRLVLQKLAATASKLIATHANKIKQQPQGHIRYLSTGTEAPTPKSHVKSIRLMTTKETQKSKANTVQREVNTEVQLKPKHSQTSGKKSMKRDPKKKDVIVKNLRLVKKSTSYNVIESETILKVTDMTSAANRSLKRSADGTLTYLYRNSNTKLKQTKGNSKARGNTMGYYYEGIVNRLRTHPQYIYDVCNCVPSCIVSNEQKVEYFCSNRRRDKKYTSYFLQTFSVPSLYDCHPISLFASGSSDCCSNNIRKACPEINNIWNTLFKATDVQCGSNCKSIKTDEFHIDNDNQYDSSKNCVNVATYEESVTAELTANNEVPVHNNIPISTQISNEGLIEDKRDDLEKSASYTNTSNINKRSSTRIDIDESQPTKITRNGWATLQFWEKILIIILFWIAVITLTGVIYIFVKKPFSNTISNVKTHPTVIEIVPGPSASNRGNTYNISHIYVNDELRNLSNVSERNKMQSCEKLIDVGASIDPVIDLLNAPAASLQRKIPNNCVSPVSSTCTNATLTGSESTITVSSTRTYRAAPSSRESYLFDTKSQSGSYNDRVSNFSDHENLDRVETNTTVNEVLLAVTADETAQSKSNVVVKRDDLDIFENNKKNSLLSDTKLTNERDEHSVYYNSIAELMQKVFNSNDQDENLKEYVNLTITRSKSSVKKVPSIEENIDIISNDNINIIETPEIECNSFTYINEARSKKKNESKGSAIEKVSFNEIQIAEKNRVKKQVSNYESNTFGTVSLKNESSMNSSRSASNASLKPDFIYYNGSKYSLKDKKPTEKFSVKGMKKYLSQVKMQSGKNKTCRKPNQNIIKYDKTKHPLKIKELYNDLFLEPICYRNLFSTSQILQALAKENVLLNLNNETGDKNEKSRSSSCSNKNSNSLENDINKQSEQIFPFNNEIINVAIALAYNQHDYFQKYKNISEKDKRVLIPHCSADFMDTLLDIVPSFEIAKEDLCYRTDRSDATVLLPHGIQCDNVCTAESNVDKSSQSMLKLDDQQHTCNIVIENKHKEKNLGENEATTSLDPKQLEISGESIIQNTRDTPTENTLRKEYSIPNKKFIKNLIEHHNLGKDKQNFMDEFNSLSNKIPEIWDQLNSILETTILRLEVSISDKIITEMKKLIKYPESNFNESLKSPIPGAEINIKEENTEDTIIQIEPDQRKGLYDDETVNLEKFNIKTKVNVNFEDSLATEAPSDDSKMYEDVSLQCCLVDSKVIDELALKTQLEEASGILPGTSKYYFRKLSKPALLQEYVSILKSPSEPDGYVEVSKDNVESDMVKVSIETPGATTDVTSHSHPPDFLSQAATFVRENIMVLSSIPIFILAMAVLYLFILMTKLP